MGPHGAERDRQDVAFDPQVEMTHGAEEVSVLDHDGWTEVLRTTSHHLSRERALVLEAAGIPYLAEQAGAEHVLSVPSVTAARAAAELGAFDRENVSWPPAKPALIAPPTRGLAAAATYAIVIAYFYHLQTIGAFGLDWWRRGMAITERIRAGEWWRGTTALTLHSDVVHLTGNMAFGAMFVAAAAQALGNGVALLGILLAGILGNLLNALIQNATHSSVGASTASFGAVGLLVAFQWSRRHRARWSRLQRWTPPFIGIVLLGYLGTSGERTDVMAHLTGFGAGCLLGALVALLPAHILARRGVQCGSAALALLVLVIGWLLAFLR